MLVNDLTLDSMKRQESCLKLLCEFDSKQLHSEQRSEQSQIFLSIPLLSFDGQVPPVHLSAFVSGTLDIAAAEFEITIFHRSSYGVLQPATSEER